MKRSKVLWALALLNVVLVVVLMIQLGGENVARAQEARPRGEFVLIPADIPGVNNGVIYMLDTRNGVLGGWIYEQNQRRLVPIPPIDVARLYSR
ncbi:MAG: hypothetical protein ACM359_24040 [Bacillota bacterium]